MVEGEVRGGKRTAVMSGALFPTCGPGEYQRRYDAVQAGMAARDLDALVVYGEASSAGANLANCVYLTGYEDPWFSYVLVFRGRAPILLNSNPLYLPHARTAAVVDEVESTGWEPGARIADLLRGAGLRTGRIGLVGVRGIHTSTPPQGHHMQLVDGLPDAELVDATDLLQDVRRLKSNEEIELLRRGAELTDATVAALADAARVGASEHALSGAIHQAAGEAGGVQRLVFIGATPMHAPELVFPRQSPSTRVLREGDILLSELSTSYAGYPGQVHRPLTIAAEPTTPYQRLFDVAADVFHAVLGAMGPGCTDDDVRRAARPILERSDTWTMDALVHGWGLSIEGPRLDVTDRALIERPQTPITFEPGMAMVIQPHVLPADRSMGVQVGSLVVVTEDGAQALQRHPMQLQSVGGG